VVLSEGPPGRGGILRKLRVAYTRNELMVYNMVAQMTESSAPAPEPLRRVRATFCGVDLFGTVPLLYHGEHGVEGAACR